MRATKQPFPFPKTLKIGAHEIALHFKPHWDGSDEELAYTKYEAREIVINADLDERQRYCTLLHEIMHVANPQMNHELLASLAEQLGQALIDNGLTPLR